MSLKTLFSLEGKTALVVGASRGIGLAIAREIAAAGAHTVLAARSADKLKAEAEALAAQGWSADYREADMMSEASIEALGKEFASKADILINVSGTNIRKKNEDYTKEEYERILQTNLHSIFQLCQHIGPGMAARGGGKIIHIGSLMSLLGIPYLTVYAITKAALAGLTRTQAAGLHSHRPEPADVGRPGDAQLAAGRAGESAHGDAGGPGRHRGVSGQPGRGLRDRAGDRGGRRVHDDGCVAVRSVFVSAARERRIMDIWTGARS
jgi:NAD(P)-dependent dehydrogenase (short-subunit alcohol dehydrogenase family)